MTTPGARSPWDRCEKIWPPSATNQIRSPTCPAANAARPDVAGGGEGGGRGRGGGGSRGEQALLPPTQRRRLVGAGAIAPHADGIHGRSRPPPVRHHTGRPCQRTGLGRGVATRPISEGVRDLAPRSQEPLSLWVSNSRLGRVRIPSSQPHPRPSRPEMPAQRGARSGRRATVTPTSDAKIDQTQRRSLSRPPHGQVMGVLARCGPQRRWRQRIQGLEEEERPCEQAPRAERGGWGRGHAIHAVEAAVRQKETAGDRLHAREEPARSSEWPGDASHHGMGVGKAGGVFTTEGGELRRKGRLKRHVDHTSRTRGWHTRPGLHQPW